MCRCGLIAAAAWLDMLVVLTCCGIDEADLTCWRVNLKHSLLKYKKSNPNFPHDGEYLLPLVRSLFRMLACFHFTSEIFVPNAGLLSKI